MTKEKLLSLIESWQRGDCPGEILNDAILDFGIDTSAYFLDTWVLKRHLVDVQNYRGPCLCIIDLSKWPQRRRMCQAMSSLSTWLQNLP